MPPKFKRAEEVIGNPDPRNKPTLEPDRRPYSDKTRDLANAPRVDDSKAPDGGYPAQVEERTDEMKGAK